MLDNEELDKHHEFIEATRHRTIDTETSPLRRPKSSKQQLAKIRKRKEPLSPLPPQSPTSRKRKHSPSHSPSHSPNKMARVESHKNLTDEQFRIFLGGRRTRRTRRRRNRRSRK